VIAFPAAWLTGIQTYSAGGWRVVFPTNDFGKAVQTAILV
jgi:hypothetical protein